MQSLAIAYRKADKLRPLSSHSRPLFPMGSQATRLASISSSGQAAISAFAEKEDSPSSLVRFPPNLLMIPFGQTAGAIADLLDVACDEAADTITMRMDVVDNPVVFSQFMEHHPCSADTTEAHYHQNAREGIDINAKALLQSVKGSSNSVQGRLQQQGAGCVSPVQRLGCGRLCLGPACLSSSTSSRAAAKQVCCGACKAVLSTPWPSEHRAVSM